jgi:acetyltransferase-like isoleucine patch superfamily enzyme
MSVLKNSTILSNYVVGLMLVVHDHSFNSNSIIVSNPAKNIKKFHRVIDKKKLL